MERPYRKIDFDDNKTTMTLEELLELREAIDQEIEKRRARDKIVRVKIETDGWYDPRKHKNAFVAIIRKNNGKIERQFVDYTNKVWDSKRRSYKAEWVFEAPVGTKLECRRREGSWKNEYRDYFVVTDGGLQDSTRQEVMGL